MGFRWEYKRFRTRALWIGIGVCVAITTLLLRKSQVPGPVASASRSNRPPQPGARNLAGEASVPSDALLAHAADLPPKPDASRTARGARLFRDRSPATRSEDERLLLAQLEKNDVCGLMERLEQGREEDGDLRRWLAPGSRYLLSRRDLAADDAIDPAYSVLMEAAFADSPEAALSRLRPHRSGATDFYRALILAGLLETSMLESRPVSEREALNLFERLRARYPRNGAYALFHAAALIAQGVSPSEWRATALVAMRAPEFDDHFPGLNQAILRRSLGSSEDFLLGAYLASQTPVAKYLVPYQALRAYLRDANDPEMVRAALPFGRTMMAPAARFRDYKEGIFWSALHHAIGQGLARAAWDRLYPGQAWPQDLQDPYTTYIRGEVNDAWSQATDRLRDPSSGECDRALFDRLVAQERGVFQKLSEHRRTPTSR